MNQGKVREGIIAGGNWIVDHIKVIDIYPAEERLSNIREVIVSSGGAPYNVLKSLFNMQSGIPLEAIGLMGDDSFGRDILGECKKMTIDTSQLQVDNRFSTSYTDVMLVEASGRRTFFHYRGANQHLNESNFDFTKTNAKIFHLGYLLLLDGLDTIDSIGETGASKVLKQAQEIGILTSVDVVSEQSDRYSRIIPLSLPYVDYLFINEIEVERLTGVRIVDDEGYLDRERGLDCAEILFKMGVKRWVIIHFEKGAFAVHISGDNIYQKGVDLPVGFIKGTVGAGDAFAAGVLKGIHDNMSMRNSLILGISVAITSLRDFTSTEGILPLKECLSLASSLGLN